MARVERYVIVRRQEHGAPAFLEGAYLDETDWENANTADMARLSGWWTRDINRAMLLTQPLAHALIRKHRFEGARLMLWDEAVVLYG